MEEKENKNLKVSDCHTAHYRIVDVKRKDGSFKEDKIYICDVCKQSCKVVEMIVDSI